MILVLGSHHSDEQLLRMIEQKPEPAIAASGDNRRSRELRTYGIGAQIIADLGVRKMRVMSAPWKLTGLAGFGLEVVEYVNPLSHEPNRQLKTPTARRVVAGTTAERSQVTPGEDKSRRPQHMRIGLVASRFNQFIVEQLLEGARDALERQHIAQGFQHLEWAPGAFELPLLADQFGETRPIRCHHRPGCGDPWRNTTFRICCR